MSTFPATFHSLTESNSMLPTRIYTLTHSHKCPISPSEDPVPRQAGLPSYDSHWLRTKELHLLQAGA